MSKLSYFLIGWIGPLFGLGGNCDGFVEAVAEDGAAVGLDDDILVADDVDATVFGFPPVTVPGKTEVVFALLGGGGLGGFGGLAGFIVEVGFADDTL